MKSGDFGANNSGRQKAETQPALLGDLLRYVIEHASSAVAVHDLDMRYIYVSQRYLDVYSLKEKDVIGKRHYDLFPDPSEKWLELHRRALAGEVSSSERDLYTHQDGRIDWTRWECRPWYEKDGRIGGIIVYTEIITERVLAEVRLSESEEKYRALVENSLEGIAILDLEGTVIFANQAVARALEIPNSDALVGRKVFEFIAPESMEKVAQDFANVMKGVDSYVSEYCCLTPAGKEVWLESIGKIIQYESKPADLISLRNITARKQAEAERGKLQAQLNQAHKMESVGRLAGGVAHDFNNMLGVILGHVEMTLEKMPQDHPLHAVLSEIFKAAQHSAVLTRQLLAFARRQTVAPKVLDLNETVAGMLSMMRRLIGEDIELIWRPGSKLHQVRMDPSQIDQILANLCVNSRDAIIGNGRITIETSNVILDEAFCAQHTGSKLGSYVLIAFSDSGRGMGCETRARIFEPFFTTKELGKGTGLGLATVYGIVKQNKGYIDVSSEPGHGARFTIFLPRYSRSSGRALPPETAGEVLRGMEVVLLVEDEPLILKMASVMLERMGYTVLPAATPGEAIQRAEAQSGRIDLLMTDVVMPEMNGRDLAETLQNRYPNLKCLFMSGYAADVIAHHGVLDSGVHYIQKPFLMSDLAAKVRIALETGDVMTANGGKERRIL